MQDNRPTEITPARPIRHATRTFRLGLLLACLPACAGQATAAESDQIVSDRPDFVESSNVVGKNRFQIETSVVGERNNANGVKDSTHSTPTLLRFGVGDTVELRLETDGRIIQKTGGGATLRGYGDLSLGVKWHALDADGARPSIGLLAHADLDSGSAPLRGDGTRPSLRMAAEWELPDEWSLGVMPGLSYQRDGTGRRYTSAIFGAVLGKSWNERLRTFIELATPRIARAKHGGSLAVFDFGGAYMLSDSVQVDAALSRGLNQNSADLAWTMGLSARF